VIKAKSGHYFVQVSDDTYICSMRGRLKKENLDEYGRRIYADPVAVGDVVIISILDRRYGIVEEIRPRKTKFSRRLPGRYPVEQIIVSNADQIIITVAAKMPDPDLNFLDRFLVIAESGDLDSIICVNKIDLVDDGERAELRSKMRIYEDVGYEVIYVSAKEDTGMERLTSILVDRFSIFVGASGVGKSSILNVIQPGLGLRVKEVNRKTGRGRHTTSSVQRIALPFGGYVADTPGIRRLNFWDLDISSLDQFFPEMREHLTKCRYKDCSHKHEPGCRVRDAVEKELISRSRYESYLRLIDMEAARAGQQPAAQS
jgi:ribosome biogenesis GTPase